MHQDKPNSFAHEDFDKESFETLEDRGSEKIKRKGLRV
jgi:hypothetical protein